MNFPSKMNQSQKIKSKIDMTASYANSKGWPAPVKRQAENFLGFFRSLTINNLMKLKFSEWLGKMDKLDESGIIVGCPKRSDLPDAQVWGAMSDCVQNAKRKKKSTKGWSYGWTN